MRSWMKLGAVAAVLVAAPAAPALAAAANDERAIGLNVGTFLLASGGLLFLFVFAISSTRIVPQGKAGVVERFGRYVKTESAGLVMIMPLVSSLRLVSMKEQVDEYKPQHVITADNVGIQIDAVLFFQIVDSVKAIYEVENFFVALEMLTMTTLRDIIGEMTLDECLTSRERINARLRNVLDDATAKWGIKVNRVEIRAIQPPDEIQIAMEKQMKAERGKRARILEAEGERQAAILCAEGEKQASILEAEGDKQAAILEAEGERQAAALSAQGHAQAYRALFAGIKESNVDNRVITIRYLEALERIANGQATKLVLPYEATGILSALTGIVSAMKFGADGNGERDAEAPAPAASAAGMQPPGYAGPTSPTQPPPVVG